MFPRDTDVQDSTSLERCTRLEYEAQKKAGKYRGFLSTKKSEWGNNIGDFIHNSRLKNHKCLRSHNLSYCLQHAFFTFLFSYPFKTNSKLLKQKD